MSRADETLAKRWGVSSALVMQLRGQHLKQPEDFTADPQVTYTPAGEKKMATLLNVSEKKEGAASASPPALPSFSKSMAGSLWMGMPSWPEIAPAVPEVVGLLVLKVWPNPTFVAVRTSDGKDATVRVRINTRLARGQMLRCREWQDGRVECVHPGLGVPLSTLS